MKDIKDWSLDDYADFTQILLSRLAVGRETYGIASLHKSDEALREDISQELLDVCGWSFLLWYKLQQQQERMKQLETGGHTDVPSHCPTCS